MIVWCASAEPIRSSDTGKPSADEADSANAIYYPVSPAEPSNPEAVVAEVLLNKFMEKHSAMDYPAAAEYALRLVNAIPDRAIGYYNLACAQARLNRAEAALAALSAAIDHGWSDLDHTRMDADLRSLSQEPEFAKLIERIRSEAAKQRIVPGPLRTERWELVADELRAQIPAILQSRHVPGADVALIRDGKTVWVGAFGVRDRRTNEPLQSSDQFRVRPPVHVLALLACEQLQAVNQTTVAAIVASGLEFDGSDSQPKGPLIVSNPSGTGRVTTINLHGLGGPRGAGKLPDRAPSYSGSSVFGYMKLWIETASNASFSQYCEGRVLKPIGVNDSRLIGPKSEVKSPVFGHSFLGSPMELAADSRTAADDSFMTSAADLAQISLALIARRSHQAGEPQAVPAGVAAAANGCNSALDQVSKMNSAVAGGLGLAVRQRRTEFGQCVELADTFAGMGCLVRMYPDSGIGVVILFNSANGADAAKLIAHQALGGE